MDTVFLSHTAADSALAATIIEAFESARWSVLSAGEVQAGRDAGGERARLAEAADCIVLMWSAAAAASSSAAEAIALAIRAWAQDRLVIVRADAAQLPAGLRDIAAIDLSVNPAGSMFGVIRAAAACLPARAEPAPPTAAAAPLPHAGGRSWRLGYPALAIVFLLAVACGVYLAALAPRSPTTFRSVGAPAAPGHAPYTMPDTGPSGTGSGSVPVLIFGLAVAAITSIGFVFVVGRRKRRRVSVSAPFIEAPAPQPEPKSPAADHVFVSYSRRDQTIVDRIVSEIENSGLPVWIDRRADVAGAPRYAAPIVAAIKASRVVALMCSQHSFASDHVIREVYVAGDFKKPFIAFQLDPSEFPDELLYFLSGFPRVAANIVDAALLRTELARLVG